jgi:hypothetical protein
MACPGNIVESLFGPPREVLKAEEEVHESSAAKPDSQTARRFFFLRITRITRMAEGVAGCGKLMFCKDVRGLAVRTTQESRSFMTRLPFFIHPLLPFVLSVLFVGKKERRSIASAPLATVGPSRIIPH